MITKYRMISELLREDGHYIDCPCCGSDEIEIKDVRTITKSQTIMGVSMEILCKNKHAWNIIIKEFARGIYIAVGLEEINYTEYIKSDEWKKKADAAKEYADNRCQLCNTEGTKIQLHAHHRTYERLGSELPEDITVLCAKCHGKFHGIVE